MNFDIESMARITNEAASCLKKRTLGGVDNESALKAIQKGVSKALNEGEIALNEAVSKVQQELNEFKGKSAQEMAELTSSKDKIVLDTKEAAKAEIQKSKQALKEAMNIRKTETVLPNKNTRVRKVKPKTGAVMEKEVTPENKTVKYEVTTLDGQKRRSNMNPVTGKPINTYTDTKFETSRGFINKAPSANGGRLIEYDAQGNAVSTKAVNNKKVKPVKPQMVGKAELVEKDAKTGDLMLRQAYSDGSYEIINYSESRQQILEKNYFNAKNQRLSFIEHSINDRNELVQINTQKFNPETGNFKETSFEHLLNKSKGVSKYNDEGKLVETILHHKGYTRIVKAKVNEYGLIQDQNLPVKVIYPKESPIKETNIEFLQEFMPKKETVTMKDGSKAILSKFDGNYNPSEIRIIPKNVSAENPEYVITGWNEMGEWCEKHGKANHRTLSGYYHGSLS